MQIGDYLITAIREAGARHVFGIQGDYVLKFYAQLCAGPLTVINTCDEQGSGFAADAYARMNGFGVVCVTYGVGGFKVVNSTAQAYAELSPVLVISGAPGVAEREGNPLLHHKVRSFDTQLNVFREMTVAQAVLDNAETAAAEIRRVIDAIQRTKRPGYIELPRDMVQVEANAHRSPAKEQPTSDPIVLAEALSDVMTMLAAAQRAIVIVGIGIHRFGLQDAFLEFIKRSGLPFVSSILSKSVIAENHPRFLGVYAGAMTPDAIKEAVEGADCVIAIGAMVTDFNTGMFTSTINLGQTVALHHDGLHVKHHHYADLGMKEFLEAMTAALPETPPAAAPAVRDVPSFVSEGQRCITMARLMACLDTFLDDTLTVIAEPGDPLFGSLDLTVREQMGFVSPAYYASLGFAVPGAVGIQLAVPERRPLALVGDGSFQMTGMELSTVARYGLTPIVMVLNNGGYGTFRSMVDGAFNDLHPWRYADLPGIIGAGQGYTVTTEDELVAALAAAKQNSSSLVLIEVRLDPYDVSSRLRTLTDKLKNRV